MFTHLGIQTLTCIRQHLGVLKTSVCQDKTQLKETEQVLWCMLPVFDADWCVFKGVQRGSTNFHASWSFDGKQNCGTVIPCFTK